MQKNNKKNKKIIGIDLDNTIINYNPVFKILAKKKNYNLSNINKENFKKYIIKNFNEEYWTVLQPKIYGKYLKYAKPYPYCIKELIKLKKNYKIIIVSHKTRYPYKYKGDKINLQKAAMKWLINLGIFKKYKVLKKKDVYFEKSIKKKINRIKELKCKIFIDDLDKILELLPKGITKIKFGKKSKFTKNFSNWKDIKKLV